MRRFLVAMGMLAAVALLGGAPAKAELGCGCVKFGVAPVCVAAVEQCLQKIGGLCLAPCSYQPPRKVVKRMAKPHGKKKKM